MKLNKRIYILDALRGFAAINVVLLHFTGVHTIHPFYLMTDTYVTAFFVISGFSNYISYRSTGKFFKDSILYYLNRILRVTGFMIFFYLSYFIILWFLGFHYQIKILYTNVLLTFWSIIKYPFLSVATIFGSTKLNDLQMLNVLSYMGNEYNPEIRWSSQIWSIIQEYMFYFLTPFIMIFLNKYKKLSFFKIIIIFLGLVVIVESLTQMNLKVACNYKSFGKDFWQSSCDALSKNKSFYYNEVDVLMLHIRLNDIYRFRAIFNILNYNLLAYVGGMLGSYIYVNIWQYKLESIYNKYKVNTIFYICLFAVWFTNYLICGPVNIVNKLSISSAHSNMYFTVYNIIYMMSYVFIFSLWRKNENKYFGKITSFIGLLSFPIYIIHFFIIGEKFTNDIMYKFENILDHKVSSHDLLLIFVFLISIIYIWFDIRIVKYKNKCLKYIANFDVWNKKIKNKNNEE